MPHVHVMGPDAEAKIILSNQNVVKSKGFSAKEIKLIQKVVKEHKAKLMEAWEDAKS